MLDLSKEEIFWAIFVLTQLGQIAYSLIFLSQPLFFMVWHNPIKANFEEEYAAKSPLDLFPLIETKTIILPLPEVRK